MISETVTNMANTEDEVVLPFSDMIGTSRRGAYLAARKSFTQWSVPKVGGLLKEAIDDGWEVHSTKVNVVQVRKEKSHDKMWEHDVWSLFAGYDDIEQMNDTTGNFNLDGLQQIDVFAYTKGHVICIECKSKESPGKDAKLRDYIDKVSGYRAHAEKIIKKAYGTATKISWCIATRNFEISKVYYEHAKKNNILLLEHQQVDYLHDLFKKSGQVSMYQLLSYFFSDIEIESLKVNLPCFKTTLGNRDAYFFTATAKELLPISYVSHRGNFDPNEIDAFQRAVTKSKLKEIAEYVDKGGFFPNSILLNIDTRGKGDKIFKKLTPGGEFGTLYIPGFYKTAWIIDGQHRLLSLDSTSVKDTFKLPVIAFFDLPDSDQANMFVTINNKQKRVPAALLIELSATLKWSSTKPKEYLNSMAATVMFGLSKSVDSPLRGCIQLTGDSGKKPFSTNTIVVAIKKDSPFGSEVKNKHKQGKYWQVESTHEKSKRASCDFLEEILSRYFSIIQDHCDN